MYRTTVLLLTFGYKMLLVLANIAALLLLLTYNLIANYIVPFFENLFD